MMSNEQRLVYMANQIARNFEAIGHDAAAKATADHIVAFWDPRMKTMIFEHLDQGGGDLSPLARDALLTIRHKGAPEPQTRATVFNAVHESGHADAG